MNSASKWRCDYPTVFDGGPLMIDGRLPDPPLGKRKNTLDDEPTDDQHRDDEDDTDGP